MGDRKTSAKLEEEIAERWVASLELQNFHLFEKTYARVCLTDVESNSSWYIPQQEFYVYHPNKLGEIRVVYDCSSEFQRRGLNKELLSGSNQTNQILFGVLSWFREHDVAFMADIESRLYQVVVSEEQRYYLNSYGGKIETITTQSLTVRGMCMCCLVPHPPLVVLIMSSKNIYRLQGCLWIPSFRDFAAKHLCWQFTKISWKWRTSHQTNREDKADVQIRGFQFNKFFFEH